jgi:hypothetical protein
VEKGESTNKRAGARRLRRFTIRKVLDTRKSSAWWTLKRPEGRAPLAVHHSTSVFGFNRELPRLSATRIETDFVISPGVSPGFASTSTKISSRRGIGWLRSWRRKFDSSKTKNVQMNQTVSILAMQSSGVHQSAAWPGAENTTPKLKQSRSWINHTISRVPNHVRIKPFPPVRLLPVNIRCLIETGVTVHKIQNTATVIMP